MITDSVFYRLFKELPAVFFELIGHSIEEQKRYRFDSCELKQTAFRIDGLFVPVNGNDPLYFIEIQFRYDAKVYSGLFAEVFIYLHQNKPTQDWRAVIIYKSRRFEPQKITPYQPLLLSDKVTRIYLDELPEELFNSVPMKIVEFIISDEEVAGDKGKILLTQIAQEIITVEERLSMIDLVETIIIYKFSQLSREELRQMFGLDDLRKTKVAQEFLEEGRQEEKTEIIEILLRRGFEIEAIAEIVRLEVEKVQEVIENLRNK